MKTDFSATCSASPAYSLFQSIFMNCQEVKFYLNAWFGGFVAFLAVILLVHQYGRLEISLAIPKYRTPLNSLILNLQSGYSSAAVRTLT